MSSSENDDDDDYMSEKFLITCDTERPGLIRNRAKEREIKVENKRIKICEERKAKALKRPNAQERLEEGLNNPITADNKGFAMLAKMGYKQGESLGNSSKKGIIEPIKITIKTDRDGLGRQAALEDLMRMTNELRQKRMQAKNVDEEITTEQFRKRMVLKEETRLIDSSLAKCQRACERLDLKENIDSPPLKWFWPDRTPLKSENEDEVEDDKVEENNELEEDGINFDYEPIEKLQMLNNYLRTSYNYCHWCGVQYEDATDINNNCPGADKDDH